MPKQKKTKRCNECNRTYSPEGFQAHKRPYPGDELSPCNYESRYGRLLRQAVSETFDEMELLAK